MTNPTRRYHANSNAGGGAPPPTPSPVETVRTPPTCGVRYGAMNWLGEFRIHPESIPKCGMKVVIQSERGIELGEQISLLCHNYPLRIPPNQVKLYVDNSGHEFYRYGAGRVLREASPQDVNEHERLNLHVRSDIDFCSKIAAELRLDMKIITAEHLLGGERIVFYFRSEDRVDFRELVRQLAQHYQTRIEMRQVGARDEARLIADYEICGRECCCKNFLKKLRPVTMRMAKIQKSTLDPSKVSGRCGRLRCCLRYEHEVYDDLVRRLPKIGARVETEFGPATVIDRQILTQLLLVRGDNDQITAVPFEEIKLLDRNAAHTGESDLDTNDAGDENGADLADSRDSGNGARGAAPERRERRERRPRGRRNHGDASTTSQKPPPPPETPNRSGPAPTPPKTGDNGNPPGQPAPSRGRRRRRRPPRDNANGSA